MSPSSTSLTHAPLKALLFDIGGVVVVSPFQAILDYEKAQGIPVGWVNYAISKTAPDGSWQRLERGEIPLDDGFYHGFARDLTDVELWKAYHGEKERGARKERAKEEGQQQEVGRVDDPTEKRRGETSVPPPPSIDARKLFWMMMSVSRAPDPHMFPALRRLRALRPVAHMGALSNTVIFPSSHPFSVTTGPCDPRGQFDIFISSAHVGLRKPDRRIYELALRELCALDRRKGGDGVVAAADVLFLDDIGANLRAARELGMRTLKVNLGRTREAVVELEKILGIEGSLLGEEKGKL